MASRNADGEDSEDLTGCNWKECHDQLVESALGAEEGSMCVMHLLTLHCMAQRGRDQQGCFLFVERLSLTSRKVELDRISRGLLCATRW